MHLSHILAALRRHPLAAGLIALQIALVCAVLCNAFSLITGRLALMDLDSGVDERSLALVQLTGYDPAQATDVNAKALSALAAIPGVQSVSAINTVPFGPRVANAGVTLDAEGKHFGGVIDFYVGGPGSDQALGLKPSSGRLPQPGDYAPIENFIPADASVLITHTLAEHLWPGEQPLGREFWMDKFHFRVIGVLDHLAITEPGGGEEKDPDWSVYVPAKPGPAFSGSYLLRADPRDLTRVYRDAEDSLARALPDVVFDSDDSGPVPLLRHRYFAPQRAMAGMLAGVMLALLLVTALGIVGLASFWVDQRRREIGIRRALGARRRDILHHFQLENFLIVSFGIVAGLILTIALNVFLVLHYGASPLPMLYLPLSAVVVWALGQLAVLRPAMQAAATPPAIATRSV
jgi:putative ABC transport system permease protein